MRASMLELAGVSLIAACVSAPAIGGGVQQDRPIQIPRDRVLNVDMRVASVGPFTSAGAAPTTGLVWRADVPARPEMGAPRAVRVQVRLTGSLRDGTWTIRIKDGDGNETERFAPGDPAVVAGELWTDEVPGAVAVVELWAAAADRLPVLRIEQLAYTVIPSTPQAISGPDQRIPINLAPVRIRRLGPPVARLRFMLAGQGQATCTGFLVGRRLLLTNQHCITSAELASAVADFGYDDASRAPVRIRAEALIASSASLDYSLLLLAREPGPAYGRLYVGSSPLSDEGHPLVIVQHPGGRPKQVSIADCRAAGVRRLGLAPGDFSDFGHLCDTLGGSSGSPVLDWNGGRVVGLHHLGFREGSPEPVNQAVHLARVLDDIKRQDAGGTVYAEVVAQPR